MGGILMLGGKKMIVALIRLFFILFFTCLFIVIIAEVLCSFIEFAEEVFWEIKDRWDN